MPRDIHAVLHDTWGHPGFRPMQEEVIRAVMAGKDTLALLPTGGGKSLCFQVPALAMGKLCLVVSPLIALMKDQVQRLKQLGVRAAAITSGMSHQEIDRALDSAAHGKLSFLYVSPERIGSELFTARLPRMPLGLIAVDEAHCISQWGYDFRPAYLLVAQLREVHPGVPVLALTASATPEVAKDIMQRLAFRKPNLMQGSFHRPELTLWTSRGENKLGRLRRIATKLQGSGIVYLRSRRGTVQTAQFLLQHGITAAAYHAGMPVEDRDRVQRQWATGEIRFVAATNAFGMGIDKADVRCVVHLEPPPDMESYYQEAGRAGRDGRPAYAVLLADAPDEQHLRDRLEASFPSLAEVRRVYQAFADQHRIALGSGQFEAYDLDLAQIARRTDIPAGTVQSALKALELDGGLALSDGARSPTRVMMRAAGNTVHDLRISNNRYAPLLEALLRNYGGLFEEPAIVDEERLAQQLARSVDQVRAMLRDLARDQVIFHYPRKDLPTATLLTPRRDAARLTLEPQALQARHERARERLDTMLDFTFREQGCRDAAVLRYFGQPTLARCGRCDNCKAVDRTSVVTEPTARWSADEAGTPVPGT